MSYALLFSGQGTQHGDMFPWLDDAPAAQPALAALAEHVGGNWRERLRGPGRAVNVFAQPVVVGTANAAWQALRALLASAPEVVAGYSVGELAAFSAVDALEPAQAIGLAGRRADIMDRAVVARDTGLLAISSVTEAEVVAECHGVECAIRIADDNNVYGGERAALFNAQRLLRKRAKFKPLCVSIASHTSWMRPALHEFECVVRKASLRPPISPVALDATGATSRDAAVLARALVSQIAQCVQWRSCMGAIAERRPSCVLEIGGGQALARMWASRFPNIPVRSLDEFRTSAGAASWIERHS